MTDRQIAKQDAQDKLMFAMQAAFCADLTDEERKVMSREMARVERLFGYEPHSWTRGV